MGIFKRAPARQKIKHLVLDTIDTKETFNKTRNK